MGFRKSTSKEETKPSQFTYTKTTSKTTVDKRKFDKAVKGIVDVYEAKISEDVAKVRSELKSEVNKLLKAISGLQLQLDEKEKEINTIVGASKWLLNTLNSQGLSKDE